MERKIKGDPEWSVTRVPFKRQIRELYFKLGNVLNQVYFIETLRPHTGTSGDIFDSVLIILTDFYS